MIPPITAPLAARHELGSIPVIAKAIEPNARVVIEWPGHSGPTTVEWRFASQENGTTFVSVSESGFTGSGDELPKYVADSTQGFTLLFAGLKAFLEHDQRRRRRSHSRSNAAANCLRPAPRRA